MIPKNTSVVNVDRPEIYETYGDSVMGLIFDDAGMRLDIGVTRLESMEAGKIPKGKRYTACRLVLTRDATLDLYNKLNHIVGALTAKGIIAQEKPQGKAN